MPWQQAPPEPPAFFAAQYSTAFGGGGGFGVPANPLLTEPSLLAEPAVAELSGAELASGRACGTCLAESLYRPCGPIPVFVVPCGFFLHGAMLGAPCVV